MNIVVMKILKVILKTKEVKKKNTIETLFQILIMNLNNNNKIKINNNKINKFMVKIKWKCAMLNKKILIGN